MESSGGLLQYPVGQKDRDKTAFVTRRGCWMLFGFTCAPGVFRRLMDLFYVGLSYGLCRVPGRCQFFLEDVRIVYRSTRTGNRKAPKRESEAEAVEV